MQKSMKRVLVVDWLYSCQSSWLMCSRRITKKRMFSKNIIQFTSSYHAFTTSSVRVISQISSYLVISSNGQLFLKYYFGPQITCFFSPKNFFCGLAWYIFRHVQDILQHEKTKTVIQHFVRSYSNERNKNVTSTTLAINDVFELKWVST